MSMLTKEPNGGVDDALCHVVVVFLLNVDVRGSPTLRSDICIK